MQANRQELPQKVLRSDRKRRIIKKVIEEMLLASPVSGATRGAGGTLGAAFAGHCDREEKNGVLQ